MGLEVNGQHAIDNHATPRQIYERMVAQGSKMASTGPINPTSTPPGLPFTLIIAIDEHAVPFFDVYRKYVLDTAATPQLAPPPVPPEELAAMARWCLLGAIAAMPPERGVLEVLGLLVEAEEALDKTGEPERAVARALASMKADLAAANLL